MTTDEVLTLRKGDKLLRTLTPLVSDSWYIKMWGGMEWNVVKVKKLQLIARATNGKLCTFNIFTNSWEYWENILTPCAVYNIDGALI